MRYTTLCVFFSFIFCGYLSAQEDINQQQRDKFIALEKITWNTHSSAYNKGLSELKDYPLKPYLEQKALLHNLSIKIKPQIDAFLQEHRGTPLDWPLRKKWLAYLIKRNRQAWFIDFYVPSSESEYTCYYYRYLLNKGKSEKEILPKVTKLWVKGKSQPKACDPLFNRWAKAGYRTKEVVWERIRLAAQKGKHTLLPYLTTLLPEPERYLGKLYLNVRRNPSYIVKTSRFKTKSLKETEILFYGLKRLIWRNPNNALKTYHKTINQFPFTEDQKQELIQKFALALASKNHRDADVWLHKVNEDYITNDIVQWRIAAALRTQNWFNIKKELLSLPEAHQSSLQWRYWFARSLLATANEAQGHKVLLLVAQERHYYGFLAASYLGETFKLQNTPLVVKEEEIKAVLANKSLQRAFEFFYLDRFTQARKEWNHAISQLTERESLVAAKVAHDKGWFDRAIFTLAEVGYMNDVNLRFPLAYSGDIIKHANERELSSAWVYAIARRESSFMTDASSPVSAKGLMQLMPATAKKLVRKKIDTRYLLDANNNINLGTKYLRQLLDQYDGNAVLATASYNAGPYRVKSWLKNLKSLPADMWIETIPYKETRNYVKSVLAYQEIYQYKTGVKTRLFDSIIKMKITP